MNDQTSTDMNLEKVKQAAYLKAMIEKMRPV